MPGFDFPKEPRHLDITDLERIERFRTRRLWRFSLRLPHFAGRAQHGIF